MRDYSERYQAFWDWFRTQEQSFHAIIMEGDNSTIEKEVLDPIIEHLKLVDGDLQALLGDAGNNMAELIVTPDGRVTSIVFAEELIAHAPQDLPHWRFIALKPAMKEQIPEMAIKMHGYEFSPANIQFHPVVYEGFPDEVEVIFTHKDMNEDNKGNITQGVFIFLDNYFGEMNMVTRIDFADVCAPNEVEGELIPIQKLDSYLKWRESEFLEKTKDIYYDDSEDSFQALEGNSEQGRIVAVANQDVLQWEGKSSYPWMLALELSFPENLSTDALFNLLNQIEDEIEEEINQVFQDKKEMVFVCRETIPNLRTIFYACKDFRKATKIVDGICQKYQQEIDSSFDIYKDKYWRSVERFNILG
ncbi:hypothetical protein [Ornithobacterium rhinotracheale]|uniref:hypothetical protein n=1 Tax=Ornithobacterium rhinotracheale TaxID=28251 RepID=UPI002158B1D5|nr:hypothetical protein [Ornithobacterium rhinotracheale]UVD86385.1 hypothetical protein NV236_06790 [Ornithobacterium rhinotracheale]